MEHSTTKTKSDTLITSPESIRKSTRHTEMRLRVPKPKGIELKSETEKVDCGDKEKRLILHISKSDLCENCQDIINNRCHRDSILKRFCGLSVYLTIFLVLLLGFMILKKIIKIKDDNDNRLKSSFGERFLGKKNTSNVSLQINKTNNSYNITLKLNQQSNWSMQAKANVEKISDLKIKQTNGVQRIVSDNIYWGDGIEDSLPNGFDKKDAEEWENYLMHAEAVKLEVDGCGQTRLPIISSRLIKFKDGRKACGRFQDCLECTQGPILSLYFAQLLNLTNIVPVAVKVVDYDDPFWINVAPELKKAGWISNKLITLTLYVDNLQLTKIPLPLSPAVVFFERNYIHQLLFNTDGDEHYIDLDINVNINNLLELAQWSDCVIFDYITANIDRVIRSILESRLSIWSEHNPAHNVALEEDSSLLVFLDNQSTIVKGYRLLQRYGQLFEFMLRNFCLFRKPTIKALKLVHKDKNIGFFFSHMLKKRNSLIVIEKFPSVSNKNLKILYKRIGTILKQVDDCKMKYYKNTTSD